MKLILRRSSNGETLVQHDVYVVGSRVYSGGRLLLVTQSGFSASSGLPIFHEGDTFYVIINEEEILLHEYLEYDMISLEEEDEDFTGPDIVDETTASDGCVIHGCPPGLTCENMGRDVYMCTRTEQIEPITKYYWYFAIPMLICFLFIYLIIRYNDRADKIEKEYEEDYD